MIKRPRLVHFLCLQTENNLSLRASLSLSSKAIFDLFNPENLKQLLPTKPIESLGLLRSRHFRLKLIAYGEDENAVITREIDSDEFGNFSLRIPLEKNKYKIKRVLLYETLCHPGVELLIGSFIPQYLASPFKILITDFDKTLVDTKYSSARELMTSLRNPVNYFPIVENSVLLVKKYIEKDFHPFVVSASPHFYENAIRDWLYQHGLFTSNIYLKDYRSIFALFAGDLSPKDLKNQGFYKLNQIVSILLMTGMPQELVLIGDGFESDTLIYLALSSVILDRADPWMVWNSLKEEEAFKLTNQQHSRFLSKFHQLKNLINRNQKTNIKIYIRCKKEMIQKWEERKLPFDYLNKLKKHVTFYEG
jgi:hypothetical protein